jgi:hypothetical protein
MNGLIGTRVLLLDDEPKEALPVIKAFSKTGIPIAYFDGNHDGFPLESEKLSGVRLAILDIDLGFGGPAKNLASTLTGAFSRIISDQNGPYGILVWTNHHEHIKAVAEAIFAHKLIPKPVYIVSLKKAQFINGLGDKSTPKSSTASVRSALQNALKKGSAPFECLQLWENLAFAASTNVTNSVSDMTGTSENSLDEWQKAWREEMLRLLLVIAKARYGKRLTEQNLLRSAFFALNPLQLDRMDSLVEASAKTMAHHAKGIFNAQGTAALARRAGVNSMLHLATDHLRQFNPGNLYLFEAGKRVPSFIPGLGELLTGWIPGSGETLTQNMASASQLARVCAVEISPACDHAQDKIGLPRLIAGVLLPWEKPVKIKSPGQFIKGIGPLKITSHLPAGEYGLYLNSRYIASSRVKTMKRLKAAFRLKPELLADIQTWGSYQGSRQGITIVE